MEAIGIKDFLDYGVSGAVVLAIVVGMLIPRWVHTQRMRDKDDQLSYLRTALDKRDEQVDKLITQQAQTNHLLEDIKATADRRSAGGPRR